jgi:hypothetical protein
LRSATFAQTIYASTEVPLDRLNRPPGWGWWKPLTTDMVRE